MPTPPKKKTYCFHTKKKVIENNAYATEQSLPLTICLYDTTNMIGLRSKQTNLTEWV